MFCQRCVKNPEIPAFLPALHSWPENVYNEALKIGE